MGMQTRYSVRHICIYARRTILTHRSRFEIIIKNPINYQNIPKAIVGIPNQRNTTETDKS